MHTLIEIGQLLKNEDKQIPSDVLGRFQEMWEGLSKEPKRKATLSSFGWWFASGQFDTAWSITFLLEVFRLAGSVDGDFAVAEQLAKIAREEPRRSVAALKALIESDKQGWQILGWKESARSILETAMAVEGTREDAESVIHFLGAKGNMEFRDLLKSSHSS